MRTDTYNKLERLYRKYAGYIKTRALLAEGLTNRQIAALAEEDYLEKVCYGYYWMTKCGRMKPPDYKCIEVCLSNPRAVICLDSACFYQNIIEHEPKRLEVATERTDRSVLKMNFPVKRHFFSNEYYKIAQKKIDTVFGSYNIYDAERSICDLIRLGKLSETELIYLEPAGNISFRDKEIQYERLQKYAELFKIKRFMHQAKDI